MQHRKEPPLIASLDRRGPSIGFLGLGVAVDCEYVNDAIPYRLVVECLVDRHRLNERSRTAVLRFDGALQLGGVNLDHMRHVFTAIVASVFWRATISSQLHSDTSAICLVST